MLYAFRVAIVIVNHGEIQFFYFIHIQIIGQSRFGYHLDGVALDDATFFFVINYITFFIYVCKVTIDSSKTMQKKFFLLFGLAIWHLFCNFVAVFAKITECDGKKLE